MQGFQYLDYREALADWFWQSKEKNPKMSFRFVAKHLGLSAPNHFHLVIMKKRHMSQKTFARMLKLARYDARQMHFMRMLFRLNTKSLVEEEKQKLLRELEELRLQSTANQPTDQHLGILGHTFAWYLKSGSFMFDGKTEDEICKIVAVSCPFYRGDEEVRLGLGKLIENNMVEKIDGIYYFDTNNVTTKWDFDSEQIKQHHRNNLVLANEALSWPLDKRFFSNVTVQCDEDMHAKIIQDIRNFCIQVLAESDKKILSPQDCKKVISLNFVMFPYFEF